MDKAEDQAEVSSSPESRSLIPVSVETPTLIRLRSVLAELGGVVASRGTGKQKMMLKIVGRIADDMVEEMEDQPPEVLAMWFNQMGQVISWVGTGSMEGMSDQIRNWLQPRAVGIQLALEEGEPEPSSAPSAQAPLFTEEELVAAQGGGDN